MAGLTHAYHHYAPLALEDQPAGMFETFVDALLQLFDCFDFHADGAKGGFDQAGLLGHGRLRWQ
jgi:hypothetical protein